MSPNTTDAPRSANSRMVAAPIPLAPPRNKTLLPSISPARSMFRGSSATPPRIDESHSVVVIFTEWEPNVADLRERAQGCQPLQCKRIRPFDAHPVLTPLVGLVTVTLMTWRLLPPRGCQAPILASMAGTP